MRLIQLSVDAEEHRVDAIERIDVNDRADVTERVGTNDMRSSMSV